VNNPNLTEVAINIPTGVLWALFLIVVVVVSIISWILVHHWGYYGIKGNNKVFAKSLYFVGLGTFSVILFLLIGSYNFL
jgi:hypothetical protein